MIHHFWWDRGEETVNAGTAAGKALSVSETQEKKRHEKLSLHTQAYKNNNWLKLHIKARVQKLFSPLKLLTF